MAPARVATVLGEQRGDFVGKVDALDGARLLDRDFASGNGTTDRLRRDHGLAVLDGTDPTGLVNGHDARRFGSILDLTGNVPLISVCIDSRDDQLAPGVDADYVRSVTAGPVEIADGVARTQAPEL